MDRTYKDKIKTFMVDIFQIADNFDECGLTECIGLTNGSGMREAIKADMLLFLNKVLGNEKRVDEECIKYVNDCLGYSFGHDAFYEARECVKNANSAASYVRELLKIILSYSLFYITGGLFWHNELLSSQ